MITGINELKKLTKYISPECKCKFNWTKCNSNQWWKSGKCWCECKKHHIYEKNYVWNPRACISENGFSDYMWWNYRALREVKFEGQQRNKNKF